ncbi:D-3-phosphoglycerate dehydrogenase [Kribbella aluminosa]|uniref:D-3-phosphoglycerate dehydrogenase n=1 Tax=Kribbella aluminosa TaxID=416017 RepID=A0ABS4UIM0_9ACTN|nr:NAD(P)-dependent oxidoreductase [Kribbella aluminosa]MBP2351450.1 D-3-phosphoglycerate dehydrogenase [Kribbella aluminosa]
MAVTGRLLLVLDSLLDDDLTVETAASQELGWELRRWSGDLQELGTADAVVHVRTAIDRDLISRLARCRVVGRFGTGVDTVDLAAAETARLAVVNVRDYCTAELANHTLGLGLALVQRLGPQHDNVEWQRHGWQEYIAQNARPGAMNALVIGLGAVGRHLAESIVTLGWRTMVTSRRADVPLDPQMTAVSLAQGLARADIVFVQCELGPTTRGFFNEELIRCVRPGTILVNTARVALLDENAVAAAIQDRTLGGLGLDARLAPEGPLAAVLGHPRVLVTPHIGWYSERSLHQLRRRTVTSTITTYPNTSDHDTEQDPPHALN